MPVFTHLLPHKRKPPKGGFLLCGGGSLQRCSALLAELAQSGNLCGHDGQFRLCACQIELALGILHRLFGSGLGLVGLLVIKILAAHSRVGQDGNAIGLNLKNATGDKNEFFAAIAIAKARVCSAPADRKQARGGAAPSTRAAVCWVAVTLNGRYAIGPNGALMPLGAVGGLPMGSAGLAAN